ncbi:NAD-dependent succinate-semialdehyde dehydrogenase [Thalassobacillus hwangdonensis]|uniref:NAD-dependent succinate-semialdehyde dehydrogenase n=1 Tax=Thalassobacillus hwangdonensis TaxID=546108 RepID=A0ABW3L0R0_9BACI
MISFEKRIPSLFINGEWREAETGKTVSVNNPATMDVLTEVSYGDAGDTEAAVQAAEQAFPSWSGMTGRERATILYKAYQLLEEEADRIARILTMEQGKPYKEAIGEVHSASSFLLWYAEEASRLYGEWIPSSKKNKRLYVIPQAVGVIGAITPWNFPASMITRKLGPALAAGCTVVLKPASATPLTAIEIIKVLERAGVPKGVVNLVTGNTKAIGETLLQSNSVRLITFTGSTEVGKYLMRESAQHVKKLSLELGGHAPIIVFEDANLEQAAEMTLASKFRNSGQTCICANRLYVQRPVVEAFMEKLTAKASMLKLGNGMEDGTDLGPLIDEAAKKKVIDQLKDATSKGAKVACGGKEWEGALDGNFYPATILTDVTDDMHVMYEETFGPLLPVQVFDEESDVIQKANDSEYGLAAYFFTKNLDRSIRVSEKLEYGIIGVNDVIPATAEAPFGGVKQSGVGKEGGHQGIHEYVEWKYVSMGIEE